MITGPIFWLLGVTVPGLCALGGLMIGLGAGAPAPGMVAFGAGSIGFGLHMLVNVPRMPQQ